LEVGLPADLRQHQQRNPQGHHEETYPEIGSYWAEPTAILRQHAPQTAASPQHRLPQPRSKKFSTQSLIAAIEINQFDLNLDSGDI
jgi:hypothetical protein